MFLRQPAQNSILRQVGILEFVHQDMFKLVPVGFAHNRIIFKDPIGVDQHVVEIHGVILDQPLLIKDEKAPDLLIAEVLDRVIIGSDEIVLGTRDGIQQGCRTVKFFVEIALTNNFFHQGKLIIGIKNDIILVYGQKVSFAAQDPAADGMKGAQPQAAGLFADQFLHAVIHLARGFVRESHRQDAIGWHIQGSNQIGDAVCKHAGFTRARSRQNKRRSGCRRHSLLLLRIEKIKQVIHRRMIVPKGLKSREGG